MQQTNDFWAGFKTAMRVFGIANNKGRGLASDARQDASTHQAAPRKLFEDYMDIPTFIRRGRELQGSI